jgi:hypothetical protein
MRKHPANQGQRKSTRMSVTSPCCYSPTIDTGRQSCGNRQSHPNRSVERGFSRSRIVVSHSVALAV